MSAGADLLVSAHSGEGLSGLIERLTEIAGSAAGTEPALVTRARQASVLRECANALQRAGAAEAPEVVAEELRRATEALGRLTGRVDVEQVLDSIFAEFCIGK